jgi:DNA-binding GntR family transcriptional regulator
MALRTPTDPVLIVDAVHPGSNGSGRSLLKERAYAEIKQRILSGGFTPRTFLSERQMAHQLAMSKTPIRAALQRLEVEGLVTISPQQGIIVRDLSVHEIADLYEMRAALETYVATTLAGRLSAEQINRLHANLKAQQETCPPKDIYRAVARDTAFHLLFCEFLGKQEILRVMGQMRDKIFRVITRVFQMNPGRIASSYTEHRAIAQAVIRGEGALAAQRIMEHLELGKKHLLSPRRD